MTDVYARRITMANLDQAIGCLKRGGEHQTIGEFRVEDDLLYVDERILMKHQKGLSPTVDERCSILHNDNARYCTKQYNIYVGYYCSVNRQCSLDGASNAGFDMHKVQFLDRTNTIEMMLFFFPKPEDDSKDYHNVIDSDILEANRKLATVHNVCQSLVSPSQFIKQDYPVKDFSILSYEGDWYIDCDSLIFPLDVHNYFECILRHVFPEDIANAMLNDRDVFHQHGYYFVESFKSTRQISGTIQKHMAVGNPDRRHHTLCSEGKIDGDGTVYVRGHAWCKYGASQHKHRGLSLGKHAWYRVIKKEESDGN